MGVDDTSIELLSLDDFGQHLATRLQEAVTAVSALANAPVRRPALGEFRDADQTAVDYEARQQEYLDRLRRLISALVAAQAATATIGTRYRTIEALNVASLRTIRDLLSAGT